MGDVDSGVLFNKILLCRHVFDSVWIHAPTEIEFDCRECGLHIKACDLRYGHSEFSTSGDFSGFGRRPAGPDAGQSQ